MNQQTTSLIQTLKACLREKNITYVELAGHLALSEASVKRMFSKGDLMHSRLEQIADILDMKISELWQRVENTKESIEQLDIEQERIIVGDIKLLLLTHLLLNHWSIDDILSQYVYSYHEIIRYSAQLDRMGIIELLPGDRIRTRVSGAFHWQKQGPIEHFFETKVRSEFFSGPFNLANDALYFRGGMFSSSSIEKIHELYAELMQKISFLMQQDKRLPLDKKTGIALALTLRDWEYSGFAVFRK